MRPITTATDIVAHEIELHALASATRQDANLDLTHHWHVIDVICVPSLQT